jgi:hypothetical protein
VFHFAGASIYNSYFYTVCVYIIKLEVPYVQLKVSTDPAALAKEA